MGNQSQFLPFATGAGANILPPGTLGLMTAIQQGFQSGILEPYDLNSVLRQSSFVAAMIAQFTADYGPNAVNDDGNLPNFEANFVAALHEFFIGIPDVVDQGTANVIIINPPVAVTQYKVPMAFFIEVAAANVLVVTDGSTTINVSGLGPRPLIKPSGAQLAPGDLYAGGKILVALDTDDNFQLISAPGTFDPKLTVHYGRDVSLTPNKVIAAVDSSVTAWVTPLFLGIYIANSNTGATTLSVNGLPTVPITMGAGTPLTSGQLTAGSIAWLCYDGTEAQLLNSSGGGGAGTGGNDISGQLRPYWLAVNSASLSSPPASPSAGDAYLLPTGCTGAWSGNDGKVAQWSSGAAWVYVTYPTGSEIAASDTGYTYQRQGTIWTKVEVNSLGKWFFYLQLG